MQVGKDKVVRFEYTLTSSRGEVLDTSEGGQPLTYLHGVRGIIPGLEAALEGRSAGDAVDAVVPPAEAYGLKDADLIQDVPRRLFGDAKDIRPGMQFQAQTPEGPRSVTIVSAGDETVRVDANHPLAGETLHFAVKIVDVRDATAEELAHGHAHGPGGHHHH